MPAGKFISFEGGEGGGKSTQVARLAEHLRQHGIDVVTTREPGGSPGAEAIRELLVTGDPERWDALTEALLHFAARQDHLRTTIRPALEHGKWVLTDRFEDSTVAYQAVGRGLDRSIIDQLSDMVVRNLKPDMTVILDIDPAVGIKRTNARSGDEDRYERMDLGFHQRLRQGFLDIAAAEPERCAVIDGAADIEIVSAEIEATVASRIGLS